MYKTTKDIIVATVSSLALCATLGACSGTSNTGSQSNSTSNDQAVKTLYNIDNVDSSVKESGERCMASFDTLVEKLDEYQAASPTEQQNMLQELNSLYSDATSQSNSFQEMSDKIYGSDSDWNTDTKQYAIDVISYIYQQGIRVNDVYSKAMNSDSSGSTNSNATN